ncbi:type IV toxin-antitoxin system AbiEi family antitoxin domain-containing protein [Mycobacterium sp. MYCO198283]|uniref:type IV toxin-antitoxin system AbiEi family antitoxin domain-containing protein n=1 Tax=Mycobacterium sp. MYCO198283 TaxID=2883505 RepID=UPI001E5AE4D2|nr:type IV toxin-antitoxin system AbiEi family antitoxin domain-containing protein [Mycobacterium sp. MYCO198283]MCG5431693.1 type IV toxin-antitoxin system AbiEi family antitoxin domain-containing protein [Mycobacterium sp. MYCO198283]
MDPAVTQLFCDQGGVATSAQLLSRLSRRRFAAAVERGEIERIWTGVYCLGEPDATLRLRGLDLAAGVRVPVCLGTAAALYGFDTETTDDLHVLNPPRRQLRNADGLVVHRRDGAPLRMVDGRLATTPAWTAVEVARSLRRGRALATLDAALRSQTCTRPELWRAAIEQAGRRGIVAVRDLLPLADPRAESPMESVVRCVMHDGGLAVPELQYELVDGDGRLRRLDFAWPDRRVAAEYDGEEWHGGVDAMRRDRRRQSALLAVDWVVVSVVAEDLRRPWELVGRIETVLRRRAAAA